MNDKLEDSVNKAETMNKVPGLNDPENYVLTHNRVNSYIVLLFSDLTEAEIYKMLYRDSTYH